MTQKSIGLKANTKRTFSSKSSQIQISGLPVTNQWLLETINLLEVPQDERNITLKIGYNGTSRTLVHVSQDRNLLGVVKVHSVAGTTEFSQGTSGDTKVEGGFTIIYTTDCGDESRDVTVEITVTPNHREETAEISYKVSPLED